MTREEIEAINALQPGEELDRIIAEEVMGWRIHLRNTAFYVEAGKENSLMENATAPHDWSPSRNHAAAWRVYDVERTRCTHTDITKNVGFRWQVCLYPSILVSYTANGKTFEEAMCKAALMRARGMR